jgi:hypothetical protein
MAVSTATSAPSATNFFAVSGTTGARFSPGAVSLGTKMRIAYFLAMREDKSKQQMYSIAQYRFTNSGRF